jgi:thiopurine S-methyltransferase
MMNRDFWEERYTNRNMGWDLGGVSPPLRAYIDQLKDKDARILVPGAGNGYEVRYLHRKGFRNVYALDFAQQPLQHLREALPDFPEGHLLRADFFELEARGFDLILEQTFFCALPPARRPGYVQKMRELLSEKGKLAGLLFDFPLTEKGPPFGGSKAEYEALFSSFFTFNTFERAYNSIPPRQGTELFFIFTGKS